MHINGQLDGECSEWHENGELKAVGLYRDGEKHGRWLAWDDEGKLTEEFYEQGQRVCSADRSWR